MERMPADERTDCQEEKAAKRNRAKSAGCGVEGLRLINGLPVVKGKKKKKKKKFENGGVPTICGRQRAVDVFFHSVL